MNQNNNEIAKIIEKYKKQISGNENIVENENIIDISEVNQFRKIGKIIDREKYKSVFNFMISQFPEYKKEIEKSEILTVTEKSFNEIRKKFYFSSGGFNVVTKTIVLVELEDIEETLIYLLSYYILDLISPLPYPACEKYCEFPDSILNLYMKVAI